MMCKISGTSSVKISLANVASYTFIESTECKLADKEKAVKAKADFSENLSDYVNSEESKLY